LSIPLLDGAVAVAYPFIAHAASALTPIGGAAAAIVLCTAALRLLLLPLSLAAQLAERPPASVRPPAVRGERTRAALAPRVAELRQRYAKDPDRLATELTALYRTERVSPLAGCLPVLLQAPFFMVVYRIFTAPSLAGRPNALLAGHVFGVPLGTHLFGGGYPLAFLPVTAALLVLGWVAARRARRVSAATHAAPPTGVVALLPYLSVLSVAVVPLAAALYLVTTLAWTAVENAVLRRGLPAG
jgi:YidC/Oxa1 family membrane protein insertase